MAKNKIIASPNSSRDAKPAIEAKVEVDSDAVPACPLPVCGWRIVAQVVTAAAGPNHLANYAALFCFRLYSLASPFFIIISQD